MKLAHLSDLHLGYRFGSALSAAGVNQREADVAAAFRWAIDDLIAQAPDVVVVPGDVFHAVRPTNLALLAAVSGFQRLKVALPRTDVLMVSGDHDTPRNSETASILGLLKVVGLVLHQGPTLKEVESHGYRFLLCPSGAAPELGAWDGFGTGSAHQGIVLVAHAENGEYGKGVPTRQDLPKGTLERPWSYVALGHHHVCKQVGERAWYCGSLEYTSSDPWGETRQHAKLGLPGKGYLLVDLPSGETTFRAVTPPPRLFLDLEGVQGEFKGPEELTAEVLERLAWVPDGACVRLVLYEVPRTVRQAFGWPQLAPHKERLLSLHLDMRRPRMEAPTERWAEHYKEAKQLPELLREFLTEREAELPDLEKGSLVELGAKYLPELQTPEQT